MTVSKNLGRQIPDNLSLHPFIGDEHRNILLVLPIFLTILEKELPLFQNRSDNKIEGEDDIDQEG